MLPHEVTGQNSLQMRSFLLGVGAFGILGAGVVAASSPTGQDKAATGRPVLELHRDGCQKCHGAEAELMSPGWAEARSRNDLEAILDQMVIEQAGMPALTRSERDALLSFHKAISKGEPWAAIIDSGSQRVILESTQNTRLSALLSGRKVVPQRVLITKKEDGTQLLRWHITLPKGAHLNQLQLTVAKGEGTAKRVVTWKAADRPYSHPL